MATDNGKIFVSFSIDAATIDEWRLMLDDKGLKYSRVIERMMRKYIEENRK